MLKLLVLLNGMKRCELFQEKRNYFICAKSVVWQRLLTKSLPKNALSLCH